MDPAAWGQCERALANLLKYVGRNRFREDRTDVCARHLAAAFAALGEDGDYDDILEIFDRDVIDSVVDDAMLDFASRPDSTGVAPVERYLAERGARETPAGREYLRGLKSSRVGVFEVLSHAPDGGVELRDLLTEGPSITVLGDPALPPLPVGEYVGLRLTPFRDVWCMAGGVWILGEEAAGLLQAAWKGEDPELAKLAAGDLSIEEARAILRDNLAAFISNVVLEQELSWESPPDEEGTNEDGEAFDPHCVSWAVSPLFASEIARRLDASPLFERCEGEVDGGPIWRWLRPLSGSEDGMLGSVWLGDGKLELFVNSAERAERGAAVVAAALGSLVRESVSDSIRLRDIGAAKAVGGEPA
jgi:hypothetical protein